MKKERLIGIDVIKILCALFIFGRHAIKSGGCHFYIFHYLIDDLIVGLTGPIMTAFFIMSGFSIQYVYGSKKLFEEGNLKKYYVKRLISLFPMYLFVHIVGSFFYGNEFGIAVRLFPIETIGIQTWFETLFGFLHNGGTWFVSCLLVAYFVYPQIGHMLQQLNRQSRVIILAILLCIEIYSLYIVSYFGLTDNYDSPIFRTVEFLIGVVICSLREEIQRRLNNWCYCLVSIISISMICFLCTREGRGTYFICIPICLLVYSASRITYAMREKESKLLIIGMKIINYASSLCYPFYILQCLLWKPFFAIYNLTPVFEINRYRCMLAFGLLLAATIVMHEIYEKPLKKVMNRCYNKTTSM